MFCSQAGYEARFVPSGFLPQTAEDRLLIAPPERNMDVSLWQEQTESASASEPAGAVADLQQQQAPDPELEAFRRQLEGLL